VSLEGVRSAIEELTCGESPVALALTGAWGSGKTFYWRKVMSELKVKSKFATERYAYVSLFGVNDLDTLRFLIFQQMTSRAQIGEAITTENLRRNTFDLLKQLGRKATPLLERFVGELPYLGSIGDTIRSGAFLTVRDATICIDDFERRGEALRASDVLGLVSMLKEERNCRVALIFDRDRLGDAEQDYSTLREKVVDIEVQFEPTPSECCDLVFRDEDSWSGNLREFSLKLQLRNIRVLRKLQRVARMVSPHLVNFEPALQRQAAQTLALAIYCLYVTSPRVPPIAFVKGLNSSFGSLGEKLSDEQETWREALQSYGYIWTSDFDLELVKTSEMGYVDTARLLALATEMNKELVTSRIAESVRDVWGKFRNTFADNTDDFVASLTTSVKDGVGSISPGSLNSAVRVLRDLGFGGQADELLDLYTTVHSDNPKRFDPDNLFVGEVDPQLMARFTEISTAADTPMPLSEAALEISQDSYSGKAERAVLAASEDDLYSLFKGFEGPELQSCVRGCLRLGQFTNSTDEQRLAAERATAALRRIAKESSINKLRVKAMGVSDL
jgi:hypothetical protein